MSKISELIKKLKLKPAGDSKEDPIGAELKPIKPIKPIPPEPPIPVPKPIKPKEEDK